MSGRSSSPGAWWSVLEPAPPTLFSSRGDPDDPRLGDVLHGWKGGPCTLELGQPVLLGFPSDEGVRRNHGRPGAALAPHAIRRQLYRFTTWDRLANADLAALNILDLGNMRVSDDLETAQAQLGHVLGELLKAGAVPVLLGGGHETAFGHYLGYAAAGLDCAIINVDAHLDVRPFHEGAHSGSAFRQAMEHSSHPLKAGRYVVLGAQAQSVARAHWQYVHDRNGRVHWLASKDRAHEVAGVFGGELGRLGKECQAILVSVDADAFCQADVPGTSAPSPIGLNGKVWPEIALRAGAHPRVRSLEVVEINPLFDRDEQSVRWAALGIHQFLVGLATRARHARPGH